MNRLSITASLCFIIHIATAQIEANESANRVAWYASSGLTINSFAFSGDKNFVKNAEDIYEGLVGYQIGIGGKIPIKGKLSLKPELNLITRGGSFESVNEGQVSEKLTYLNLPILLSVGLNKWNVDLGPTVGYKLGPSKAESGNIYEPIDFGFNAEVGYALTPKLRAFTRYYLGVTSVKNLKLVDQSSNREVDYKNRTFQISFAYQINSKK